MQRWSLLFVFCVVSLSAKATTADSSSADFFEQHVRPLLASKCVQCHGAEKQEGGLRLDSLDAMLAGGDSGSALVPGEPGESLLIDAVNHASFEMPPTGKLPDSEITHLTRWVKAGAFWPSHAEPIRPAAASISDEDRQWWAFQPLRRPVITRHANDTWSQNEIDSFVWSQLDEHGMVPAPRASQEQLVRRLYYDLVGVPPTPDEVASFVHDSRDDAWERLVDTLLDDPRYGEHWGRYWLDLVRFAESDGWNQDAFRPHLFHYRDYVVKSLNEDKPYPEFVREQLAGDESPTPSKEALVATGYLRLGIYEYNQRDSRSLWNDAINEITDVTADVFIGMGMACARCHDHKFDPILQKDYFKLRAFFEPLVWRDDVPLADADERDAYQAKLAEWEAAKAEIQQRIDTLVQPYNDQKWKATVDKFPLDIQACFHKPVEERTSWEHQMAYLIGRQFFEEGPTPIASMKKEDKAKYDELVKELEAFDHLKPQPLPPLMTAADFPGTASPTLIPDAPQSEPIPPGFLTVLGDSPAEITPRSIDGQQTSGRRTALAQWIGNPDNPLTTRVIVNRVWQQHFGQGIVPTASDFGHLGLPPTHPELLDWLTVTFVEEGWSLKRLHKRILMSATWQQSSRHPQAIEYQQRDPSESLLWRFRVKRLTAEQIRDATLVASGELDPKFGGASVDGKSTRRSVYVQFRRNTPDDFLQLFDVANGLASVAERNKTTTPVQSLMMFNGDWVLKRSAKMAERLLKSTGDTSDSAKVLSDAIRLAWGREPHPDELERAKAFVGAPLEKEALTDFCHVLLNSSEFIYVD